MLFALSPSLSCDETRPRDLRFLASMTACDQSASPFPDKLSFVCSYTGITKKGRQLQISCVEHNVIIIGNLCVAYFPPALEEVR